MHYVDQDVGTLILTPADLQIITHAMLSVGATGAGAEAIGHRETVGKAVIRLYTAGMTDPDLLTDAARIMAATRLLDHAPRQEVA
ncbi:hypothetical protein ACSV9I_04445 [Rhizobium sp. G187]|uniref:hypothetical protein n=1 Tax=Rhizobium sp. G187 TaxID=3451352 RepID=UPI003EE6912A